MSSNGLQLAVTDVHADKQSLTPLLDDLPTRGLFLRLAGPNASNGFAIVDAALLTSIIEMQMTGRVMGGEVADRTATGTDAAICEDILNDFLATFAVALTGLPDWGWAQGYKVGGKVDGARALGLLLEDVAFRVFAITIDIAGGQRSGVLRLAMPAQGRGAGAGAGAESDEKWTRALLASISQAEASLRVVLHRRAMALSQVDELRVGELLTLPMEAMGEVRLETASGECAAIGRLGQIRGMRAIKIAGAEPQALPKTAPQGEAALADLRPPPVSGGLGAMAPGLAPPLAEPARKAEPADMQDAAPIDMADLPQLPELPEMPELPELPVLPQLSDADGLPELPELPQLP